MNKLCIHCTLIKRYERMVLFDIETDIEKPPTNKCGHSTSEVGICIEKSKLATNSKSHKSELITNLRFLVDILSMGQGFSGLYG